MAHPNRQNGATMRCITITISSSITFEPLNCASSASALCRPGPRKPDEFWNSSDAGGGICRQTFHHRWNATLAGSRGSHINQCTICGGPNVIRPPAKDMSSRIHLDQAPAQYAERCPGHPVRLDQYVLLKLSLLVRLHISYE
jgi:hypothetical protein